MRNAAVAHRRPIESTRACSPHGLLPHRRGARSRPRDRRTPVPSVQHPEADVSPLTAYGVPVDPETYDYRRAARDALHFSKLVDRFVQNLRRVAGYERAVLRHRGATEAAPQREHASRMVDALRFEPCSPRCPNWLRYGVQPKDAKPGMTPGACRSKAHKPDHLAYAGRRVLASRKWSNKILADHRQDHRTWVLEALGQTDQRTDPHRYVWKPVPAGDAPKRSKALSPSPGEGLLPAEDRDSNPGWCCRPTASAARILAVPIGSTWTDGRGRSVGNGMGRRWMATRTAPRSGRSDIASLS
ncbi:replication initiator [Nonomuraea indica]|uniref:replication initiator n=1 Tax=Nonomuraea indica TaxID=1581193 RepID=UPI003183E843